MLRERTTHTRLGLGVLVAMAVVAPLQHLATAGADGAAHELARSVRIVADSRPSVLPDGRPAAPAGRSGAGAALAPQAGPVDEVLVTEPDVLPAGTETVATGVVASPATFAERHPAQHAAGQDPADPASTRWALLIGVNEHRSRSVADNIGSRQDAEALREHLLAQGWRDDHILLLTDRTATGTAIRDGLRWLAEKTDESSVAVFHYSGHSKKWYGVDRDGDGESPDEGLWPTDDDYVVDSELVALLDPVRPSALWVSVASCNAAGFADPGLAQPGRVLTFSSGEDQKSYEHPSWGHSVWGWFLIEQAFRRGMGDLDGSGRVSVEEAWAWARPHAIDTTTGQRYGSQDAVIIDLLDGDLQLGIPGVAPAPSAQQSDPGAAEEPPPAPKQPTPSRPAPEPEPEEPERSGGYLCVLCGSR